MITVFAWAHMTPEQRAAAVKGREHIGIKGMPPSGPTSVAWAWDGTEWRWVSAIWPDDLARGDVEIGKPGAGLVRVIGPERFGAYLVGHEPPPAPARKKARR